MSSHIKITLAQSSSAIKGSQFHAYIIRVKERTERCESCETRAQALCSWVVSEILINLSHLFSQYPAGSDVHQANRWRAWHRWCVLLRKPLTPSPPLSRELFQCGSTGASWGMGLGSLNLGKTGIREIHLHKEHFANNGNTDLWLKMWQDCSWHALRRYSVNDLMS